MNQQHRTLVEKLIHGGLLSASEVGQIVVEREQPEAEPAAPTKNAPQTERKSVAEGG